MGSLMYLSLSLSLTHTRKKERKKKTGLPLCGTQDKAGLGGKAIGGHQCHGEKDDCGKTKHFPVLPQN